MNGNKSNNNSNNDNAGNKKSDFYNNKSNYDNNYSRSDSDNYYDDSFRKFIHFFLPSFINSSPSVILSVFYPFIHSLIDDNYSVHLYLEGEQDRSLIIAISDSL